MRPNRVSFRQIATLFFRRKSFQIYQNSAAERSAETEAEKAFLACRGSTTWASNGRRASLPIARNRSKRQNAHASPAGDLLEAFEANPVIGAQTGVEIAVDSLRDQLVEANALYETKFGFIFVVCTVDRSPDEILAICRARLGNSLETELMIAAEEQRKITEIGLNKLLEK